MNSKFCKKCQQNYKLTEVYWYFRKDTKTACCKACRRERRRIFSEKNPDYNSSYYKKHVSQIKKRAVENKSRTKQVRKEWLSEKLEDPDYRESVAKYNKAYFRRKYKNDINYKIKQRLRSRIGKIVKRCRRAYSPVSVLGCDFESFKTYISELFQRGMTWENYGSWEINHIIPLSVFDLADPIEYKIACHYTNLQPLWKNDNAKKRDVLPENFSKIEYIKEKLKTI